MSSGSIGQANHALWQASKTTIPDPGPATASNDLLFGSHYGSSLLLGRLHSSAIDLANKGCTIVGIMPEGDNEIAVVFHVGKHTMILLYMRTLDGHLRMKLGRSLLGGLRRGLTTEAGAGEKPKASIPVGSALAETAVTSACVVPKASRRIPSRTPAAKAAHAWSHPPKTTGVPALSPRNAAPSGVRRPATLPLGSTFGRCSGARPANSTISSHQRSASAS